MAITTKSRTELKAYFVKNAIPTESNFADLIDAMLNQQEDGIAKPAAGPLQIQANGDANSPRKVLYIYGSFNDPDPAWSISLNARTNPGDPATAHAGLAIQDGKNSNRLFIDAGTGNVGIGTLTPTVSLHVECTSGEVFAGGGIAGYCFANRNAPNNGLRVEGAPAGQRWVWYANDKIARLWTNVNGDRIGIDADGNTQIGAINATPRARLQVTGAIGNTVGMFGNAGISMVTDWPSLGINSYFNGAWKSMAAGFAGMIDVDQGVGNMDFYVASKALTAADQVCNLIKGMFISVDGAVHVPNALMWGNNSTISGDQGGCIELGGNNSTPGTGIPYIDFHFRGKLQDFNARIINDADGQLTLQAPMVRTVGSYLEVTGAGNERCYVGGDGAGNDVQIGSLSASVTSVVAWSWVNSRTMDFTCATLHQTSDGNLKTNVTPLAGDDALTKVCALRGVRFDWKSDVAEGGGSQPSAGKHIGLVAQEVEEVFPELVSHKMGELGVSYTGLVPVLVEAIKELQEQVNRLKNERTRN